MFLLNLSAIFSLPISEQHILLVHLIDHSVNAYFLTARQSECTNWCHFLLSTQCDCGWCKQGSWNNKHTIISHGLRCLANWGTCSLYLLWTKSRLDTKSRSSMLYLNMCRWLCQAGILHYLFILICLLHQGCTIINYILYCIYVGIYWDCVIWDILQTNWCTDMKWLK